MKDQKKPRGPKLVVNVSEEIIGRSERANSRVCMISEAIKEAFPLAKAVSVDLQTCRFTDSKRGLRYIYLTPRNAQGPLLDFDQGIRPVPFEVVLKNAHVVRARGQKQRALAIKDDGLSKRAVRSSDGGNSTPIPVGGKPPPQMKTLRRFGIKAFQGFAGSELPGKLKAGGSQS